MRVLVSRYIVLVNLCFYFSPTDMLDFTVMGIDSNVLVMY